MPIRCEEPDVDSRHEELAGFLLEIASGTNGPWVLGKASILAAELGNWPLALACYRRIDPLSKSGRDLLQALRALGPNEQLPGPPAIPGDAEDILAHAFQTALKPKVMLSHFLELGPCLLGVATLCLLGAFLPARVGALLHAMVLAGFLAWLVPLGVRLRDRAWCRPGSTPNIRGETVSDGSGRAKVQAAWAMLCLCAPLMAGFAGGVGWSLVLGPPLATVCLLLLMLHPLQPLVSRFPWQPCPSQREWGALGLAGLLIAAGALASAFVTWIGLLAILPALLGAYVTWSFACRLSGLMARRILVRWGAAQAVLEPLPVDPSP